MSESTPRALAEFEIQYFNESLRSACARYPREIREEAIEFAE